MKILLLNNSRKQPTQLMAEKIARILQNQNIEVVKDNGQGYYQGQDLDFIIILGGDGTFLHAFKLYGRQEAPFLGVNMGTVGFLSGVHVNKLEENIKRILNGDYYIKEKMIMEIKVLNKQGQIKVLEAFNEAVIKSKSVRLSSLLMWINDNEMGSLRGDGIIIATQTGSTGYSLSAGGPIVDPDLEAFVLTPLSSYYLNQRPLVVAADKIITFKLTQGQDNILCLDAQIELELFPEDQVQITVASNKLKILNLEKDNFWNKIYDKLGRKFIG